MALTRRSFMYALPAGLVACSGAAREGVRSAASYREIISGTPGGAEGTVLVCMPNTSQTREVWTGLSDDLGKHYKLVAVHAEAHEAGAAIAEGLRRHRPSGLVLMNNPTVGAYRALQKSSPQTAFPPAVIVMTSFLDGRQQHLSAATGISYEVPLITVVTNLRKLIANPIERVGVVLRPNLSGFVHRQAALAQREKIRVIEERISPSPNSSELKRALRNLKQHVDVLWVLNDDHLLTPHLITEGWIPGLNERPWSPAIVGAASLVSPGQSFGTFAVLPDHTALGSQAASLLFDIADNGWKLPEDSQIQLPLSTTTAVDLVQARERFVLREDALQKVDRVLE
ncbi:MAG TPA: hypothetical protein VNW92_14925 [Polyangiaceae bacterium]|jgi:hypothetical protein|nr:hypothetical protein [Polyangiaceae bacterium]